MCVAIDIIHFQAIIEVSQFIRIKNVALPFLVPYSTVLKQTYNLLVKEHANKQGYNLVFATQTLPLEKCRKLCTQHWR